MFTIASGLIIAFIGAIAFLDNFFRQYSHINRLMCTNHN